MGVYASARHWVLVFCYCEVVLNAPPLDKNGRPIQPYDVLKVFHFIGRNRERFYMYKHVTGIENNSGSEWLRVSHLGKCGGSYLLRSDGRPMPDYEIVQGESFESREKVIAA